MADLSRINVNQQEPTSTEIQETLDPEAHYDKLYSVVLKDPKVNASPALLYGVMRGLSRRSGSVNASNAGLAEASGLSETSVQRAIAVLKERGLITVEYRKSPKGTLRVIQFPPLSTVYSRGSQNDHPDQGDTVVKMTTQGGQNDYPDTVVKMTTNETLTKPNYDTTTPLPPKGEERGGSLASLDKQPMAQSSNGATKTPAQLEHAARGNGQAQASGRVTNEMVNPWWQQGGRQRVFEFFYGKYPKMSPVVEAKIAMRLTLGEQIDDANFMNLIWHGLQWWIRKWQKEGTEDRYIPAFGRWIERRQWEQAEVNPNVVVGKVD